MTGTYLLTERNAVVGSGTLVGGTGALTLDLAPGKHRLTAVYSGSAKLNGAATKVVEIVIPVG